MKSDVQIGRGEIELQTDFLGFEAQELPHHEDLCCFGWQQVEAGLEHDPELLGLDCVIRTRPSHRPRPIAPSAAVVEQCIQVDLPIFVGVAGEAGEVDGSLGAAKMINDLVLENREDPGLERRLTRKALQVTQRSLRCFLHHVLGEFPVAELQRGKSKHVGANRREGGRVDVGARAFRLHWLT